MQERKSEAYAEEVEEQKNSDPDDKEARKEHIRMHHIKPRIQKQDGKQRSGRGFSPEELKKAGLNRADAKRLKLPADPRRKTAHEENIEALKAHAEKQKAEVKPKPTPKPKPQAKKKPKS